MSVDPVLVYTTSTRTCLIGMPGCDCDIMPDGTLASYCECHDCYVCGEIDCDGHRS